MKKPKKKDLQKFYHVLNKLTDSRYKFSVYLNPDLKTYRVEMYFCHEYVCSSNFEEFTQESALDCLIDMILYSEKQSNTEYFDKFGISFEIYYNNLNFKGYYMFRKDESCKWVKISKNLAKCIIEQKDIIVNGLCDNVVSYCQYDCYYNILIKGDA